MSETIPVAPPSSTPWKPWQRPCTKCGTNPIASPEKVAEWMGTVLPKLHATVLAPMAGEAPHGSPWRNQVAYFEGTLAATLETWRWNLLGLCEACAPEDVRERMRDEGALNTEAYSRWLTSVPPSHDAHPDSVKLAEIRATLEPFLEVAKGTANYMRGTNSAPRDDLQVFVQIDATPQHGAVATVGDCRRLVDVVQRLDKDLPQPMVQVQREREELRALLFALVELDRVPVDLISRAVRILGGSNLPREAAAGKLERLLAALEPVLKFALDTDGGPQPDGTVLAQGKSGVPLRRNDLLAVADACLPMPNTRPWVVHVAAGLADSRAQALRGVLQSLYATLSAVVNQLTMPVSEQEVAARRLADNLSDRAVRATISNELFVAAHRDVQAAISEIHTALLADWPAAERVMELIAQEREREEHQHPLRVVRGYDWRPEAQADFLEQLANLEPGTIDGGQVRAVELINKDSTLGGYAKLISAAAPLAAYFGVELMATMEAADAEPFLTPSEALTLEHVNTGGPVTVGQIRAFLQAVPLVRSESGTWVYGANACPGHQGLGEGHDFGDATTQVTLVELTHPLSFGHQVAERLGVEVLRECRFCTNAWAEVRVGEDERGGVPGGADEDGAP